MFKLWAKIIKDNKIKNDIVIENDDKDLNRTRKIYQAIDDLCYDFDLAKILLKEHIAEFVIFLFHIILSFL